MKKTTYFNQYYHERITKPHVPGIDAIKLMACFLVILFNSLQYLNYYSHSFNSWQMVILTGIRTLSLACVPLFFMITGYLCIQRTFKFKYYYHLLYLILYYGFIAIVIFFIRRFAFHEALHWYDGLKMTFDYSISPYAWFVGMYICVYLLIPLFNQFWQSQPGFQQRTLMIFTFSIVCILPSIFNSYQRTFPDYFVNLYPLFYYLLGGFMHDIQQHSHFRHHYLTIIWGTILLSTIQNVNFLHHEVFKRAVFNQFSSWSALLIAFSIFAICLNKTYPPKVAKILRQLASLSLSICLLSFIVEEWVYPLYLAYFPTLTLRLIALILPTVLIFITTIVLSLFLQQFLILILKALTLFWQYVIVPKQE